jgi:phosphatidylglycerophosphate synthase
MKARAVVCIPAATTSADLLQPIAGVPALLRLLLCAQRAGIEEILLLGWRQGLSGVQASLKQDSRLISRLIWVADQPWAAVLREHPELEKEWWEGDVWVLPASGAIDARLLRQVVQCEGSAAIAAIEATPGISAMRTTAFFRVRGPWLHSMLETAGEVKLSVVLNDLPGPGDAVRIANGDLLCVPVVSDANRAAVERELWRALKSSSDGWVDRYLNRRCSPWFSRQFVRVPLTPNQVTVIAFVIGLAAAFGFAHGSWVGGVVGALLLQWSAIIDCCDGEMARLTFSESRSGYYLDITCDNIVHVAVFAGIAWSSYQALGETYALLLGGLAAMGTMVSFVVVLATRRRRTRVLPASLDRLIDALATRDFSVILIICALTGTLPWFLWALAAGVNLFWLIALGLACRAQRAAHG